MAKMNHQEMLVAKRALKARLESGDTSVKQELTEIRKQIRASRKSGGTARTPDRQRQIPKAVGDSLPMSNEPIAPRADKPTETPDARDARIRERFRTLDRIAGRLVENKIPALIVSGPPGLGKSFTLEQHAKRLEGSDKPVTIISGSISAVGLIIALHERRDGGTVVLDDCDDVFRDETALNILKAVLDSSSERIVSYRKLAKWMDEHDIPQSFEYRGSVAFCTNIDFEDEIAKQRQMSKHFRALIDRSLYLTLTLRDTDDYMTRIQQVAVTDGLLVNMGLTKDQAAEVMVYITENVDRCYSLSIRLAMQLANCMLAEPETWRLDADATQLRTLPG